MRVRCVPQNLRNGAALLQFLLSRLPPVSCTRSSCPWRSSRGSSTRDAPGRSSVGMRMQKMMQDMWDPLNSKLYDMWNPLTEWKLTSVPYLILQPNKKRGSGHSNPTFATKHEKEFESSPKWGSAPLHSHGSPTKHTVTLFFLFFPSKALFSWRKICLFNVLNSCSTL
jgi:hypothetical protein